MGIEKDGTYPYQFNGLSEKQADPTGKGYSYETDWRGYDPQLGRFKGLDALASDLPGISPYQYAYNNPVMYNDPTGEFPWLFAAFTVAGAITGGTVAAINGDNVWKGIAIGAGIGAAVGAGAEFAFGEWGAGASGAVAPWQQAAMRPLNDGIVGARGIGDVAEEVAQQAQGAVAERAIEPIAERVEAVLGQGGSILSRSDIWGPALASMPHMWYPRRNEYPNNWFGELWYKFDKTFYASNFIPTPGVFGTIVSRVPQAASVGTKLLGPSRFYKLTQKALHHIVERHWFTSGAQKAGKFLQGTTGKKLKGMINIAVKYGESRPNTNGRAGTIFEYDFVGEIGVDISGNPATNLRVVVAPNGTVITAFPF